MFHAVL